MFDLKKLTSQSVDVVQSGMDLMKQNQNQFLVCEHIMACLLGHEVIKELIGKNFNFDSAVEKINIEVNKIPKVSGANMQSGTLSQELHLALEKSLEIAAKNKEEFVTIARMFQGIIEKDNSPSSRIIKEFGITNEFLTKAISNLQKDGVNDREYEYSLYALKKYAINLTEKALAGKLDPVIGRNEEIKRILHVLLRRTKNNPVLVGKAGVGKTAIVEKVAQLLAFREGPDDLNNCLILSLDIGALKAGAKYKGEFEERLKGVIKEVEDSKGKIILFIDEIHTLLSSLSAESGYDAGNLLKPSLARGELRCMGATTIDEYRQYIEKDSALERRLQQVFVEEADESDSISMLRGLKDKYELFHKVNILDSAVVAAVKLSSRYIKDRSLPDKAIDLMDEAASRLKVIISSKPEVIEKLERQTMQIKIELTALKKEENNDEKYLNSLEEKLQKLELEKAGLDEKWQVELSNIHRLNDYKEKIDKATNELALCEAKGDLAKASELMYSTLPKLKSELKKIEETMGDRLLLRKVVTADDIAAIVSIWTGIPVKRLVGDEKQRLITMEKLLQKRVIGQDYAIKAISNAVRRARAGIENMKKPMGAFMFIGPTGTGKTELSKALAEFLFYDEKHLLKIDMSEYMEKHSVSRLIGAPPGYVGYEQGGFLTEAVRRRPYQVILFDEIEKAHHDVFNILLQVLDEGRLSDSLGHIVDFKNTIIILTSNLGANLMHSSDDFDTKYAKVMEIVNNKFKPEFLNRLDEIIMFNNLSVEDIVKIVEVNLNDLQKSILTNHNITLKIEEEVINYLAKISYDPIYGARPLKRIINNKLIDRLSSLIIKDELVDGGKCTIAYDEESDGIKIKFIKKNKTN